MINEEIARLTGTLKWNVDNRPLLAFQNRLAKVHQSLSEFSALANKKFGIKVTLDSKALRAQLERAANAKISFKNFHVDNIALDMVQARIKESLDRTRINLKNIHINMSETLAQRAALRKQLEGVAVGVRVAVRFQDANNSLREWKRVVEQRFKLNLNADISQSKLYRNASNTLRTVGARLGTFVVKSPKIQLSVDRQHLRAEIASVLEQIKREVKIKIDLNSMTTGSGGGGGSRRASMGRSAGAGAVAGGLAGEGMGLARGFVPGLGAAYAVGQMNRINQEVTAVGTSLSAVSGSNEEFKSNMDFLSKMADEQGRNIRDIGPQFVSVLASAKASIGSKGTQDLFRGVMKYGTVMGLDGEAMKGSFRAISQMFSKDKIQAEEAQGQLAERLPAAMQLLAQANGTDVPGLRAKMQAGQLDPKKVLPQMAKIMEELSEKNGAYAAALESTRVQQGKMTREFEKSVVIFGASGFDKGLASFFKTMTTGMQTAEPLIKALGAAFAVLVQPINAVINIVAAIGSKFDQMSESLGISSKALALLPAIFFPVITAFALLALAIEDVMVYNEGGESVFGKWIAETPEAKKALDDLTSSWTALKEAVDNLFGKESTEQVSQFSALLEKVSFSNQMITLMERLEAVLSYLRETIQSLQGKKIFGMTIGGGEDTSVPDKNPRTAAWVGGNEDVPQTEEGLAAQAAAGRRKMGLYVPPALTASDVQAQTFQRSWGFRPQFTPMTPIGTPTGMPTTTSGAGGPMTDKQVQFVGDIYINIDGRKTDDDDVLLAKMTKALREHWNQYELPQETE